ncbi:MAG: isochorismate synthase [Bacteriovorax sp.]
MKTEQFFQLELQKIGALLKKQSGSIPEDRLSFEYSSMNLLDLLAHATCERIFYFKSKYRNFTFLGLGQAKTIKGSELSAFLKAHPDLFLAASFLFEEDPTLAEFILPEWIFITREFKTELHIIKNDQAQAFSGPSLIFNKDFEHNFYESGMPLWISYEEMPEHDQWNEMIDQCSKLFKNGELDKIVMSRKKMFTYQSPLDPISFFLNLLHKNNSTTNYQVFSQTHFGRAFISLTPEKLFSIEDGRFESISLAGSAPRGPTEKEDREFENHLINNEKLIREHQFVTDEITKKMVPISETLKAGPLQTMKLPYIQHRSALITAVLKENTDLLSVVSIMHPTSAVGGIPWQKAKHKILELEPYKREHYAAPIGVMSAYYSELAVGIRCATVEKEKLTVFGGAGIVSGSIAEEEWIETGTKMNPFTKVVLHE